MKRGIVVAGLITAIATVLTFVRGSERPAAEAHRADAGRLTRVASSDANVPISRLPLPGMKEDPFALPPPPPPPPSPPPPIVATPVPQRQPFPYQYFGRLANAHGDIETYLSRENQLVAIQTGVALDPGYVVDAVTEAQIVIRHRATGDIVRIDLPPFRAQ